MTVVSAYIIPILLAVLILVIIAAIARLFTVLGTVNRTLETTRADVDRTIAEVNRVMAHVETIADSTEKLIQGEVTSTLKVTHATLANIEIMTRAAADATVTVRRLTGKAEDVAVGSGLITAGTLAIKLLGGKRGAMAGSLLSGVSWGVRRLLGRRNSARKEVPSRNGGKPPKSEIVENRERAGGHRRREPGD
jgi:uncharacterized protein YoxC